MTASKNDALQLQERDLAVLRGLFESRIMTAGHIARIYFNTKLEAAKKRLQKLKVAGFIGERKRRVNERSILFLTRKSFQVLRDHGELSEYPSLDPASLARRAQVSELTTRHELEVMDVKTAFHSAIRATDRFTVAEFRTWPLLYQFEAYRAGRRGAEVLVKPDGFIRIHEKEADGGLSEHTFFLEVDRSTETLDTLVARSGCYLDYFKSGGFAVRNGAARSAYKEFPFRVLMVFKTPERRNNTAERLLRSDPPILTLVCLSTFAEATKDPLAGIWVYPADYRDAVKGTPFDIDKRPQQWGYRRETEREMLVERRVKKSNLLR
jgi:hypothetical protein